jgi:hypothetical protein
MSLKDLALKYERLIANFQHAKHMYSNIFPNSGTENDLVSSVVFSDTIVLLSQPIRSTGSVLDLGTVSNFFDVCSAFFTTSLVHDMPLRIGIAFGETYINLEQIYI